MSDTPKNAEELFGDQPGKPDGTETFLDTPVNASDPKQLKAKALSDKARALQEENDVRAILASPAGVRFMARLLSRCGWNMPSQTHNFGEMSNIEGRRQVARSIENWIRDTDYSAWQKVDWELDQVRPKPKTSQKP